MTNPSLTDLADTVTFGENTVNATPQLLDIDVTFTDVEGNFDGGTLSLSGLLAEDTVSVRNQGTDPGQIGLSGTTVSYGGTVIGTLAGGVGAPLTITFNADATSGAIDALIQNLTYANSSDAPTASRDFVLNVTDAEGGDFGPVPGADAGFTALTGAANPFNGIDVGFRSIPSFVDIDGDGDLDLVVGENSGTLLTWRNGTDGTAGAFTALTGTDNPFNGIDVVDYSAPSFVDIDGDGDLDLVVGEFFGTLLTWRNGTDGTAGTFTALTGTANPFSGIDVGIASNPSFVDIDGDGDLDLVVGASNGTLQTFRNGTDGTEGAFTALTGTANPFNGIGVGSRSAPSFVDIDGDGDLDLVVGASNGTLQTWRNGTDGTAGTFTALTGTDNPFNGINVGSESAPSFVDIDGDGDLDLVVGNFDGTILTYINTTPSGVGVTVNVTAENDAPPVVTDLPATVTAVEDTASGLDLSALTLTDADGTDSLTVVLTASAGTLTASDGTGVVVTGTGTGALTLVGTAAAIDAYLNDAGAVQYTGVQDVFGDGVATLTLTGDDGSGVVPFGTVNIDITSVNDAPVLTGLDDVTFGENTVNAAPQLLDIDVTFTDVEGNFDGGTLSLSGLLAEDTVSVRNQGTDPGQIGLSGTTVSYGGTVIGTLAGGVGAPLTITFNADATSVAIDALIQNLTYANSSDAPTASRDFVLNVTDAEGGDFGPVPGADAGFAALTGAANPFNGIDVGFRSIPSFVDIDGDGDLDLVVGENSGTLLTWRNGTDGTAGAFTALTGTDNPFNGIDVVDYSAPSFVDIDGDGDLDLVVGEFFGTLLTWRNGTDGTAGTFTALTGTANPFSGIDVGIASNPSFVDIDGDGDLDLVVGASNGTLQTFRNGTDGTEGAFTALTGTANPFNGIGVGSRSAPSFVDIDGDGDLDLVVGASNGTLQTWRNGTDGTAGTFTALTGTDNPFNGINVGSESAPSFVDIDGDGDLDLVVGNFDGTILTYINTTPSGVGVTVNVTAENDAPPVVTDLPATVTAVEDTASGLDLSALTLTDADGTDSLTVVLTASAGTLTASDGTGVVVTGTGTGALTLVGTAAAIDAYLNDAGAVQYTGAQDVFGDGVATLTLTGDDGSGVVPFGSVNIDITSVNDAPVLTGLDDVTFGENTVNAAPQLLDIDVTFTDVEGNFDGGTLSLSGLLAEDTVSVRNQGTDPGQIGLSGTTVSYGGTVIGTLAGGVGAPLTITFNADATSVAIDALIQNLTYANSSDAPTASRDFVLNVTDAEGGDLGPVGDASFTALTGTANPFNGIDVGRLSAPSFVDIDGDGDLDLVVGEVYGNVLTWRNGTDGTAGTFTALTGSDNPFNGIDVGLYSAPSFVDLDGDGDLDLVVGQYYGSLLTFRNGTDGTAGTFTALTGTANPFDGINSGYGSSPSFVDIDGDGDLDLVVGEDYGTLLTFRNGTDGTEGAFTALTGTANPFNGIDVGTYSTPSFVDLDGDGDLDLVAGASNGTLLTWRNGTDGTEGAFTALTGTDNPFNGIYAGDFSAPSFGDIDGDGDLDLVVGASDGTLLTYINTTTNGISFTVTVTPENDVPTGTGLPDTVAGNEDETFGVDLSGVQLSDPDDANASFSLTIQASSGRIDLAAGAGVLVLLTGTGTALVYGTAAALEAYLQDIGSVQYTGAQDAFGIGVATLTVFGNDGVTQGNLGTISVNLTDVVDVQTGGPGNDRLTGDDGQDSLTGDDARNVLVGRAGNDTIDGGLGNDVIRGGVGADQLSGGEGIDWVQYVGSVAGVTVDLNVDGSGFQSASDGDAEGDVISGFENVMGSDHADSLTGDDARNVLVGRAGNDTIDGGLGNDVIRGGAGADQLSGGEGIDWVQYVGSVAGVTVDLNVDGSGFQSASDGDAEGDVISGFENVMGSDHADSLTGDDARNVLVGRAGNDTIDGGLGNDVIRGGAGADQLSGGEGIDMLQYVGSVAGVTVDLNVDGSGFQSASDGDAEGDVISGFENVMGSDHADSLTGDDARNVLVGRAGNDTIDGGLGNDVIRGGVGADQLSGGEGIDWVQYVGSVAGVTVDLNVDGSGFQSASDGDAEGDVISGFENVMGSDHADSLTGDDARNVLVGRAGNDTIDGGLGNDVIRGGVGADQLSGGEGIDMLQYVGSVAGVTVDLNVDGSGFQSASDGDAEGDVISGFENVMGSDHADSLTGDDARNVLVGRAGNDTIDGGLGNDVIRGGVGADQLSGGEGIDMLQYVGSVAGVTVDLNVDGSGFQSASDGDAEGDVISGFENVIGSDHADSLTGDDARNVLVGRAGNDTIDGGLGNDVIRGGVGADQLSGGEGRDAFVFNATLEPTNIDRIVDFSAADGDTLRLDDTYFSELVAGALSEAAFRANLTGLAESADDRIIYNISTGQLLYDEDGLGGADAVQFAELENIAELGASDIFVF